MRGRYLTIRKLTASDPDVTAISSNYRPMLLPIFPRHAKVAEGKWDVGAPPLDDATARRGHAHGPCVVACRTEPFTCGRREFVRGRSPRLLQAAAGSRLAPSPHPTLSTGSFRSLQAPFVQSPLCPSNTSHRYDARRIGDKLTGAAAGVTANRIGRDTDAFGWSPILQTEASIGADWCGRFPDHPLDPSSKNRSCFTVVRNQLGGASTVSDTTHKHGKCRIECDPLRARLPEELRIERQRGSQRTGLHGSKANATACFPFIACPLTIQSDRASTIARRSAPSSWGSVIAARWVTLGVIGAPRRSDEMSRVARSGLDHLFTNRIAYQLGRG
jgi:hypothetical protein